MNVGKKKIVFITREPYKMAGARVRCYHFARILKAHGFDTEVFSFADHLNAPFAEAEWSMSLSQRLSYNARALKILAKKERGTVFYIQRLHYHALAPFLLSVVKKHPVVFDCDDWNIREDPRYHFGFFPSSKMEFLTKQMARYAKVVIVASRYLEDFLKPFARKILYLPTGVDTERFKPSCDIRDKKEVILSWAGTVFDDEMYGNLLFLIESFRKLAGRFPYTVLSLAGEGAGYEKLKGVLRNDSLAGRVRFEGWIDADMMPRYLDAIDIGFLPLARVTRFNRAKSPTKLFEYMAMARPVVASCIGEASHIVRDGVNGFLAGSQDEFTEHAARLIGDADLRHRMGQAAQRDAQDLYSLDALDKELCAVFS